MSLLFFTVIRILYFAYVRPGQITNHLIMKKKHQVFGIDIGGTGIKGGIVDVKNGVMLTERHKFATQKPATPKSVAKQCQNLIEHFGWEGPVGVGFPAIVKDDVCLSATNIDQSWINTNIAEAITNQIKLPVHAVNDADAAALCEMHSGAAVGHKGVVMLVTIGTGIGCGLMHRGRLVPNCELGVTYLDNGEMLEKHCSNAVRKTKNLSWDDWGVRLNKGLLHIHRLTSPDLIILGGGRSKDYHLYKHRLDRRMNIATAIYQNEAGTIGAAIYAATKA